MQIRGNNPLFEDDTDVVPVPRSEAAFANCEKLIERDVEIVLGAVPVRLNVGERKIC